MSNPSSILRLSSAARALMDHPVDRRSVTPAAALSGAVVIIMFLAAAVWGWQQWRRWGASDAGRAAVTEEASVAYIALPSANGSALPRPTTETPPSSASKSGALSPAAAPKAEKSAARPSASAARPPTRELSAADRSAVTALKECDSRLAQRDFAGAQAILEKIFASGASAEYLAQAVYRQGYAAHLQGDMPAARRAWQKGVDSFPQTTSGRLCALALADLRYEEVAGPQPRHAEWEAIRDLYSLAIGMDGAVFIPAEAKARAIQRLLRLNEHVVFSPAPCKGAIFHTVAAGESLAVIAKRYGVHYASLIAINRVRPQALRPGMKIKILKADCTIVVDKRELTCTWYLDGKCIKQYPC
ncbi:MAG: LysM peptidoglycan-binding domain-containing protein, partial [Planctomycetota bacterium]|nr:LysM peptidoglycan-binding domain-containing protein [Planctomycetota bacterium]